MRSLQEHESPLVEHLFVHAGIAFNARELQFESMDDGGMGSLKIAPFNTSRQFGSSPSECHFLDEDGIFVIGTLNLDQNNAPFEIDIWRVDFMPVRRWPLREELKSGLPNHAMEDDC